MSTSEEKAAEAKKRIAEKKGKEIDYSGADLSQLSSLDIGKEVDLSGADLSKVPYLSFDMSEKEAAELDTAAPVEDRAAKAKTEGKKAGKVDVSKTDLSAVQKMAFDKTRG